jgi:PAS domain S-box-containing protein
MFNALAIQTFVTAFGIFCLGIFALIRERGSQLSVAFFLLTLTIGTWLFCFSWMYSATDEHIAMLWAKAAYMGVGFVPAAVYNYSGLLRGDSRFRKLVPVFLGLSTFFVIAIITSDLVFGSLYHYSWGFYPKYDVTSIPFLLYFFGVMLDAVCRSWAEYGKARKGSVQQMRAKAVLITFGVGYLASFDYLAAYGIQIYPFGYVPILSFITLSGYYIMHHRLLAITPALAAHQIIDTMHDALIVLDREGVIRLVNKATCSLFGYGEQDLVGTLPTTGIINSIPLAKVLESLIQGVMVQNYEVNYQRTDNSPLTLSLTTSILHAENGERLGVVCVARDITEHKRADEDLMQSLSLLQATLESTADGILVVNSSGKIVSFNACFSEMWRIPQDILTSRNEQQALEFVLGQLKDSKAFMDKVHQLYDQPEMESFDVLEFKDGRVFERYSKPQRIMQKSIGRVWSFRDVTKRKQAEDALRESEDQYRNLVNTINIGIFRTAAGGGRFIQANPALANIHGYDSVEELLKVQVTDLWANPEDRKNYIDELRGNGYIRNKEFTFLKKDGTPILCLMTAVAQYDENGNFKWIHGTVEDVSEQKKLEEQLRQSQKMEAIGTLAGGVAHDFNNILTAIIGFGAMAQKRVKDDEKTKEFIGEVLLGANRAAELTRGLLAFSRKQAIILKHMDLNAIVRKIKKMFGRVLGEDIELKTILANRNLPVLVDESQIEQVLLNLVTNARDAMPDGGYLVIQTEEINIDKGYAEAHFFESPGKYAVLTVSDTGIGMDLKTRENIFEPFFTTKEVGKGTGLGLSMVYGTIKQHNGNINVYSEVGKGTTFRIYLPLAQTEAEPISKPIETLPKGKGETIIIAEDEAQVRNIMKYLLQENGYMTIEAENGEDAVRKFKENRDTVSLIILDVIMPVKNGREAYEEIKGIEPGIKTIFMSGYTDDIISRKGILEEGFDFISKPINPETLMRKIGEVLGKQ